MKKKLVLLIIISLLNGIMFAQETVDVTFRYYPTSDAVVRAFVPGSFNNWGPNSSGTISPTAPSLMTYVDSLGFYLKTVPLQTGVYNYKFHEHINSTGIPGYWYTDPLNPLINTADNNNSIINVRNAMLFQIEPRDESLIRDEVPQLIAGAFATAGDSVLLNESTIAIDGAVVGSFAGNFNESISTLFFDIPVLTDGRHTAVITLRTRNGITAVDSVDYLVENTKPEIAELPEGVIDGINYIDESTVTLSLVAPGKFFVYVIGDFNNWQIDRNYLMKQTPDSNRFWLTIEGLEAGREYRFQYLVDGELRIADPYAEKVLDPWNDTYISDDIYPDLIDYPQDKTTEIVAVLQTAQPEYEWEIADFERPAKSELIIYELLLRDFLAEHDFKTLIDTLGYFERLGVNAIELMPVNEFEGNISWGYNPSFYFAPDKYYGPEQDLKRFIDECHNRGIAVILDMVLNHSFGQSPLVRLYNEGAYGQPTADNPWYNITATHPFSVGYDFNHQSEYTQLFVDRVNEYWLTEYNVDGYRFDLSKGFTQTNSGGDVGFWGQYDASRIALLKRMADYIWSVEPSAYIILEHFADNREEKELAEYSEGMLLWGNLNYAYGQSTMGYAAGSDLSWGYFKNRGWSKPGVVTYMESHDEPWLMYKNLRWGNSNGDYNIQNPETALDRMKLASAFFFTIPGPKMMWQFGELGYDQLLPDGSERTAPKPILWNYYDEASRADLFKTMATLIKLRRKYDVFHNPNSVVTMQVDENHLDRRINLSNFYMHVTIIGNFDVVERQVTPNFHFTGKWYDFFNDDSITVSDTQRPITLAPGEFRLYSDIPLEVPPIVTGVEATERAQPRTFTLQQNFPNPFNPGTTIQYSLATGENVTLKIFDVLGRNVRTLVNDTQNEGVHVVYWDGTDDNGLPVSSGLYFYRIEAGDFVNVKKMMLLQ